MVVYLVGAGPGDPKLLTIKAKELIESAQVLIYDKLVNKELLGWAPPGCEIIYVGKREAGSEHSQEIQRNINELIVQYGRTKKVVRLKGGDPYIFGRGGEEAQECIKEGIPFEVVPGISSAFAVPAYAGIPVSHRDFNSSFAVLTGHESDKEESQIDWVHLPENIVVLMGVSQIKNTAKHLLEHGRDPETPVAAIFKGTTPEQKTVLTTLEKLAEEGVPLKPPVIFVIGPVAGLHHELAWFEKKLDMARGKKIVLTGVEAHQSEISERLKVYGMEVIPMPLIEISSTDFELPDLNAFDAVVITSQEGVKRIEEKTDLSEYSGKVFAIGPKTRDMLIGKCKDVTTGEKYNSEGLGEHILKNLDKGSTIVTLRSSAATDVLKNMLSDRFAVTEIPIYDVNQLPADGEKVKGGDAVFVMSASCAKSLSELAPGHFDDRLVVSIGPETSKHLKVSHITASTFTIQGMIDSYLNYLWTGFP